MDYGDVLRKTWNISWRNKGLWLLGILAGCSASGRGNFGSSTSGFRGYDYGSGDLPGADGRFFEDVGPIQEEVVIPIILGLLCVFLIVALVFFVLGVIGQGGLIAGFRRADDGAKVRFAEAFGEGMQNFWKLAGIRIVFFIAGFVIVITLVLGTVLIGIATFGLGLLLLIPLICLLIPVGLGVDSYIILTMVAAVEEELGVFEAFGRSWHTFKENLGPVVVMILILIVGAGILAFLVALPFIGIVVPAITGLIIGTDLAVASGIAFTLLCLIAAIPLLIIFYGLLTTYTTGAWTLTYRRLNGTMGAELPAS
ncbi:MAG: hypothetical protein BMS9Abin28_2087 [Anaerolineae bacterium]|nr:MAG: hypothetical protein BMS9Abin28_2087 [Anaerolineae bacterium]